MGALPSRETQQRGLYSHRHGRNRRSEIILIPLTSTFFPSPDCPLFRHLYNARYRRTAKYYYRALRSAEASRESDYFCTSSQLSEPEEFAKFNEERLKREAKRTGATAAVPGGTTTALASGDACGKLVDDYDYQSYTDTLEGLYQVLIAETDMCVYDTDEQLREAYTRQVQHQRAELNKTSARFRRNEFNPAFNPQMNSNGADGPGTAGFMPAVPPTFESVPYDAFLSGYAAAKQYMKGRRLHTHVNTDVLKGGRKEDTATNDTGTGGCTANASSEARRPGQSKYCKHVTSPAAYYIHPIPCAIASRWDSSKPAPVDDPLYVSFEGFYVKIMGMFGVFPSTVVMRSETGAAGPRPRPFPRKEGNPGDGGGGSSSGGHDCEDDDEGETDPAMEIEQHLMKATMFVDKDVGDQIVGNMVMLATHMYVRQCVRAQIRPRCMPMLPFFMRFPLSNVPMLQFVREFRVRLRTLLEAGTAKSGQKPMHVGMSGFNPMDITEAHDQSEARAEEEGYLYEEDVPDVAADLRRLLYMDPAEASSISLTSHRTSINTNESGNCPIFMLSGFNVQSTPLRHPALRDTGYKPPHRSVCRPSPQSPVGFPPSFSAATSTNINATTSTAAAAGRPFASPSSPTCPSSPMVQSSTVASEARKASLLIRRKNRFRMWLEDGHVCLWASAAYARRACLILAQQLNTTVDSHSVPEQRSWVLRGLLHAGTPCVPTPQNVNDVLVVAEDVPAAGLWQGDVLRCCTREELAAKQANQPLPLPCRTAPATTVSGADGSSVAVPPTAPGSPGSLSHVSVSVSTTGSMNGLSGGAGASPTFAPGAVGGAIGDSITSNNTSSTSAPYWRITTGGSHFDDHMASDPNASSGHINFTSAHPSNPLLQEQQRAPEGSFWVRVCGGLDDSYTNISEANMPPHPKMAKQLQQAAQQRAKKLAAAAAALSRLHNTNGSMSPHGSSALSGGGKAAGGDASVSAATAAATLALAMASDFLEIDRREGTLHLEEVVLSWVRMVSMLSRESSSEMDGDWVRDPSGCPVRIDRFVFRRLEFEGVRFFVGVTPRFVGQQRRIEKVLGEVYAMEKRAGAGGAGVRAATGNGAGGGGAGTSGIVGSSNARTATAALVASLSGGSNACGAITGGASGAGKAKPSDLFASLTPATNDDGTVEDHEDVLERMGFGSRKLREVLGCSTSAATTSVDPTGSSPAVAVGGKAGVTEASAVEGASTDAKGGLGGSKVGAGLTLLGGPASTGDDNQDLLQKFKYDEFLLTDD